MIFLLETVKAFMLGCERISGRLKMAWFGQMGKLSLLLLLIQNQPWTASPAVLSCHVMFKIALDCLDPSCVFVLLPHTHMPFMHVQCSLVSFDGSGFTCMCPCPGCGPKNRHFLVPALPRFLAKRTSYEHSQHVNACMCDAESTRDE